MIPQELIDKLKLEKTDHHVGQSFITNSTIMLWPEYGYLIMDCDIHGERLKENLFTIFCKLSDRWASCVFALELLMIDPALVKKTIDKQLEKLNSQVIL